MIWLLLIPSYLIGTFPSAVMVARSRGIDIHSVGSGNPGASNIARTMGTAWGVAVFVLDGIKGAVPAAVGLLLDARPAGYGMVAASVLGHMFPLTRRFRGGKGVATMGGAMLVLQPIASAIQFALWAVVRAATGKASLASFAIMIGLPVAVVVRGAPAWEITTIICITAVVFVRHVDNLKRLLHGNELAATQKS